MAKISTTLEHPFLMAIIPAVIGLGGTLYLSNQNKTVDEAEKIYWTSIQPPNDSEQKYCAYLEKYPHGNFVELAQIQCPAAMAAKEEAKEKAAELAEEKAAAAKAQAEEAEAKAAEIAEQKAEAEAAAKDAEQ